MTNEEIVKALRRLRVETGSLSCLGCGYEHSCNVHGCQILREAAAQLEHFTAENRALRSALASSPAKRAQKQARDASVTFLREMAKELNAQRAKAEAERAAALADLADARSCKTCKYACDTRDCSSCKSKTCKCRECHLDKNAWEWRGLPEAPEEGDKHE
jgi:hypothetical protein